MSQESVAVVRKPLQVRERSSRTLGSAVLSSFLSAGRHVRSPDRQAVARFAPPPGRRVPRRPAWAGGFNRRDFDVLMLGYEPDHEFHPPREFVEAGFAESCYRGPAGYRKYVSDWSEVWGPDLRLEPEELIGEPPIVVFVVEDEEKAQQFVWAADNIITGRLGKWGTPEASRAALGRRRVFFVSEIDAHQGTLRALRLPEHPPPLRRSLRHRRTSAPEAEQVPSLLPRAFFRR